MQKSKDLLPRVNKGSQHFGSEQCARWGRRHDKKIIRTYAHPSRARRACARPTERFQSFGRAPLVYDYMLLAENKKKDA